MTPPNKIRFLATCFWLIDPEEAAQLLAENSNGAPVNEWLSQHPPIMDDAFDMLATGNLKSALGKYLAERKIEETRLLTMPAEGAAQPSSD